MAKLYYYLVNLSHDVFSHAVFSSHDVLLTLLAKLSSAILLTFSHLSTSPLSCVVEPGDGSEGGACDVCGTG